MYRCLKILSAVLATFAAPALAVQFPISFNLIDTGGAAPGTQVHEGFRQAADFWSRHLTASTPVTVNIAVGFQPLDPNVLGQTGSNFAVVPIFDIADRMKNTGFGTFDQLATANLPKLYDSDYGPGTAVNVYTPGYTQPATKTGIDNSQRIFDNDGSFNNVVLGITTANAKALGYDLGDAVDAEITFSSNFGFDFNARNGIAPLKIDFMAVAIHEIGHALGFTSGVDDYDVLGTGGPLADEDCGGFLCKDWPANEDWFGEPLDLFRYSGDGKLDWTTATESYFSIDGGETAFLNGLFSTGAFNGNGNQASHWIDNSYIFTPDCDVPVTPGIGIMDPTGGFCEGGAVTALDLAAFDAIGWNSKIDVLANPKLRMSTAEIQFASVSVPEPTSWALLLGGFGLVGMSLRRQRGAPTLRS